MPYTIYEGPDLCFKHIALFSEYVIKIDIFMKFMKTFPNVPICIQHNGSQKKLDKEIKGIESLFAEVKTLHLCHALMGLL